MHSTNKQSAAVTNNEAISYAIQNVIGRNNADLCQKQRKEKSTRKGQKRVAFNDTTHEDVAMLKLEKHKTPKCTSLLCQTTTNVTASHTKFCLVNYDTKLYALFHYNVALWEK